MKENILTARGTHELTLELKVLGGEMRWRIATKNEFIFPSIGQVY
jgi:hypothetical protein